MWCLVSIKYILYGQLKSFLGKNQRWYSSIGVWLIIALVALIHNEFKCLKYLIYRLLLIYKGSIGRILLFKRLRKYLSLKLDAWKMICQFLMIFLHSFFLSKSYDVLHKNSGVRLNFLVSLSTNVWRGHLL